MNDAERISYLVDTLEGGNARRFAAKTGIPTQSVSCLRHGKYKIGRFVSRIAAAYPDVNVTWLQKGEGTPLLSFSEKSDIMAKLDSLEREVKRLVKLVNGMQETHIKKISTAK